MIDLKLKTFIADMTEEGFLKTLLISLSSDDEDFNGSNGPDYVCDNAKEEGFESNAEYYAHIICDVDKETDVKEAVKKYLSLWLGHDSYYVCYQFETDFMDDMVIVSLAYNCKA